MRIALIELGYEVRHPMGGVFTDATEDTFLTFDTKRFSFREIERRFYEDIATAPLHTLANCREHDGYIGVNAAREVAWAVVHERPLIARHANPILSNSVDKRMGDLIRRNWSAFGVSADAKDLRYHIDEVRADAPCYQTSASERAWLEAEVLAYLTTLA